MKWMFTFLLATVFSFSAFAYNQGSLTITLAYANSIQVVIDNRPYTLNGHVVSVDYIQPGQHTIQLYRKQSAYPIGSNNRNNNRYSTGSRADLLYSTTLMIRPNYHTDLMISKSGKAFIDEMPINRNNWMDDDFIIQPNNLNMYDDRKTPLPPYYFLDILSKVKDQTTDISKLILIRSALEKNYFKTEQVRELLQLVILPADKMELAKQAFHKTTDPENYHLVYDLFFYKSDREELERYIRTLR